MQAVSGVRFSESCTADSIVSMPGCVWGSTHKNTLLRVCRHVDMQKPSSDQISLQGTCLGVGSSAFDSHDVCYCWTVVNKICHHKNCSNVSDFFQDEQTISWKKSELSGWCEGRREFS